MKQGRARGPQLSVLRIPAGIGGQSPAEMGTSAGFTAADWTVKPRDLTFVDPRGQTDLNRQGWIFGVETER